MPVYDPKCISDLRIIVPWIVVRVLVHPTPGFPNRNYMEALLREGLSRCYDTSLPAFGFFLATWLHRIVFPVTIMASTVGETAELNVLWRVRRHWKQMLREFPHSVPRSRSVVETFGTCWLWSANIARRQALPKRNKLARPWGDVNSLQLCCRVQDPVFPTLASPRMRLYFFSRCI